MVPLLLSERERTNDLSFPEHGADIEVTVKIESADSIPNLQSIISASDGVSHTLTLNFVVLFLLLRFRWEVTISFHMDLN